MARPAPLRPVHLLVLRVPRSYRAGLRGLRARYPALRRAGRLITLPLGDLTPEEVLATCVALRLPVQGSAIYPERRTPPRPAPPIDRPAPGPLGYAAH